MEKIYTEVYTVLMADRGKIFQNGGSQAVRLPKSCRFKDATEVSVRIEGTKVILEPIDEWSKTFLDCLGAWDEEIERPEQTPISRLKDPFD